MPIRARLVVHGRVQGVWFRGATQVTARRVGLTGWVRNRADGAVELECEGERAAIDALIAWAHTGPPAAQVTAVEVAWIATLGEPEREFAVRP